MNLANQTAIILEAFRVVFPESEVHEHSDFFELGGDSLKLEELLCELDKRLTREVNSEDLLRASSAGELSQRLSKKALPQE